MRLINVHTLEFEEFFEGDLPAYAILSHRWIGREITHQDFLKGRNQDSAGYKKVVQFCDFVRERGTESWDTRGPVDWVWVDTCCIDKKSSAELSEAINSMYSWYSNARICIVYLHDLETDGKRQLLHDLGECSWFWRGWTLQELIAPEDRLFCDASWAVHGYMKTGRHQYRLDEGIGIYDDIREITGVPIGVLAHKEPLWRYSVAQKMSWASRRTTTRTEDTAYCLLGLLSVNMALLYGEGKRAFQRLQEEIIKRNPDQSILAWSDIHNQHSRTALTTLAPSPKYFEKSADVEQHQSGCRTPFAVTNLGLEMNSDLLVLRDYWPHGKHLYILQLGCCRPGPSGIEIVAVYLMEWPPGDRSREKVRRFIRLSFSQPSSEKFERVTMERPFYIVYPMAQPKY